jgi:uncharacterized protein YbjT (DUF2867 family)
VDALRAAMDGVEAVFLLSPVVPDELNVTISALNLCREAKIKAIAYLSVFRVEETADVPHFASKFAAERMIAKYNMPVTILDLLRCSDTLSLVHSRRDEIHFADAVKASGSPHLVYSSAEGVERKSGLGHYESKWAIEQHIRDLKLPATILRPVGFMDTFGAPAMQRGMFLGMLRANFGLSQRIQFVATYDIGWFAARALEEPERYAGRVIPLAGDDLNVADIIRTFKTVIGHKPWVAPIPTFVAKMMIPKEFADMFRWIREKGFEADIAQVRQEYPQLLTFAGWLKKYTALALRAGHGLGEAVGLEDLAVQDHVRRALGQGPLQGLAAAAPCRTGGRAGARPSAGRTMDGYWMRTATTGERWSCS